MFKVRIKHLRLLFIVVIVFGCLLFMSACNGGESTNNNIGEQSNENSSSEVPDENNVETDESSDDKEGFINRSSSHLPLYEEQLSIYNSFAFTFNGHESRIDFLGDEEIEGVMTDHFYIKVANEHGETEYEVWMNNEGLAEKAIIQNGGSDFSADSARTWIGNAFKPLYDFNRGFRYPIQSGDYTITSHETQTGKLLNYDVVLHTIKGEILYGQSSEIEYEVIVADAGEFEFILEYKFIDGSNLENNNYILTEMEFR